LAFFVFAVLMLVVGLSNFLRGRQGEAGLTFIGVLLAPLGVAHWYAAKGARLGKSYGRIISRIIAFFWLFGFPVGTLLAVWVFKKTGTDSWNDGTSYTAGFADQAP
jgi:hypothetical protein